MMSFALHDTLIKRLNNKSFNTAGQFILLWVQQSQRILDNPSLSFAINLANEKKLPLIAAFGLTPSFPDANLRHYDFMIRGLYELQSKLKQRKIPFILRLESPEKLIPELADKAVAVVVDCGYLHIQRAWRKKVAQKINCPLIQIEGDVIVPVQIAYPKEAYSAAVLRPKINSLLKKYLVVPPLPELKRGWSQNDFFSESLKEPDSVIKKLNPNPSVPAINWLSPGEDGALSILKSFIKNKLAIFAEQRNDPSLDVNSNLSPYLHYGQIGPRFIAKEILKTNSPSAEKFLEEFIVRRELAMNFCHYQKNYDNYYGLPAWAKAMLFQHCKDKRPVSYSPEALESSKTYDAYWNAAQKQMVITGKMNGYMRMYWGKKILEWMGSPEKSYKTALYLNNKYELDGRDPCGFAGVAWCFGKHDRPWKERSIFGMVRYMNAAGLERKFNMKEYVKNFQ